jgi:hypothetical protein
MIPGIKYILLIFAALFINPVNGYSFSVFRLSNPIIEKKNLLSGTEKVFVQIDNSLYIPGEKMHYKAWVVHSNSNQPEQFSSIIYYELLNYKSNRCMFWRSNTINGTSSGTVTIPDSLQGGVYTFRAFTNQMRNNDAAFYFATNILITRLNDKDLSSIPVPLPYNSLPGNIEFYPEGGHLAANLECKVGVKANLIPPAKTLTGFVKDVNDSLITSFQTDSFGLAMFSFKPQKNNSYKAYINSEEGKTNEYSLPPINSNGFSVQVTQNAGNISLKITSVQETDFENGPYNISVASRGKTIQDTLYWLKNNVIDFTLGNNKRVSGIIDFKIRDRHNEIVYENLIYLAVDSKKVISTKSIKPLYQPGEKISLQLQQNNPDLNDSLQLSVLVANTNQIPFIGNNKSVKQYLTFFSEIAASNCFPNMNESFSKDLANKLLLCVKPEDYFWNRNNDAAATSCFYPAETQGYVFSGNLLDKENREPVSKQKICISVLDSIPSFDFAVTDSTGVFHFLLDQSFDNKELILQLIDPPLNNKTYTWKIDGKNDTEFNHPFGIYNFTKTDLAYLDNFRKVKLVNTIYNSNDNKATQNPHILVKKQEQNFSIIPAYSVFPGDYTDIVTFEEITNNILSGVKLKKDESRSSIFIFDPESKNEMQNPATVFLNGVPLYDIEYIMNLKAKAISRIDVSQSLLMYGNYTFNGIVSIITKDRKFPADDFNNKRKHVQNEVEPDIPAMKYEKSEVAGSRKDALPDLRYLLYMNQSLQIYGKEPATIGITVSSLKESYSISIQGITDKGEPISESLKFDVK